MRNFVRVVLLYGAAPVFCLLAGINFIAETNGGGHHATRGMSTNIQMETTQTPHDGASDTHHDTHKMHGEHGTPHVKATTKTGFDLSQVLNHPALTSMWLMYLLMGLAHATPWLPGKRECCD